MTTDCGRAWQICNGDHGQPGPHLRLWGNSPYIINGKYVHEWASRDRCSKMGPRPARWTCCPGVNLDGILPRRGSMRVL